MEFTTRSTARAQGLRYFFIGEECKNGHISERMVESTQCIECLEERNMIFREDKEESVLEIKDKRDRKEKALAAREYERQQYLADADFRVYIDEDQYEDIQFLPKTKKEAQATGSTYYLADIPCKNGHSAKRITRTAQCVVCERANRRRDGILYPEKRAIGRHVRRARVFAAGGSFTAQEINDLYEKQYGVCVYCPADLSGKNYHIDHIMPLVLLGRNSIENLQLLCPTCNHRKGGMHPDKWHAILKAEQLYEKDIFDD